VVQLKIVLLQFDLPHSSMGSNFNRVTPIYKVLVICPDFHRFV
jgi:hypothetical protein